MPVQVKNSFDLLIENADLCRWHKDKGGSRSFVALLNETMKASSINLLVKQCTSLEERLRRRASKVFNDPSKRTGTSSLQLNNDEVIDPHEQEEKVALLQQQVQELKCVLI